MPSILIRGGSADIWCNENMLNILYWIAQTSSPFTALQKQACSHCLCLLYVSHKGFCLNRRRMESDIRRYPPLHPSAGQAGFQTSASESHRFCDFPNTNMVSPIKMEKRWRSGPNYGVLQEVDVEECCAQADFAQFLWITFIRIPKNC